MPHSEFLRRFRQAALWRAVLISLLDALCIGVSFYAAYAIRLEGHLPEAYQAQYVQLVPFLIAIRLVLHWVLGIQYWSFRFSGYYEAVRLILTCLAGSGCFILPYYFVPSWGPPRSVIALEFFITTSILGFLRFSPRFAHAWFLDRRRQGRSLRVKTIIAGAGSAGELLLRDLSRSTEHPYEVAGFVDDDPGKWGTSIGGRPVMGGLHDMARIVRMTGAEELLFAIPRLPAERLREILTSCSELRLKYKILPVSFTYLNDRVTADMLQDVSPEDLLPRRPTLFDDSELRALLEGRRVVVTGAGGSIGSELSRQIAAHAPATLVLVDINENDLYFLLRDLQRRHPDLRVHAEVADIRDRARLEQIARDYRPQDIFHAAAHKHVPLMEYAPEEAIKNNVMGTRNVLQMAEAASAERFVLISTDKAVNPSSVMGASKRIAELVVRTQAARSSTVFTIVRFGNVLGSAGSVVPLFKSQIAAGGPVTVTHPECRRYLMTIPEAVGLVLLSGLNAYGELCILEMGDPIRILDLARLMIGLSGQTPDDEIRIVFTGLRPGERLDEHLMTDEEARNSHDVRGAIRVVKMQPPPADLEARIAELVASAQAGDRASIRAILPRVVAGYEAPAHSDAQAQRAVSATAAALNAAPFSLP
jgi:FlaA1/EpsC-like NDP-sugar epimerase